MYGDRQAQLACEGEVLGVALCRGEAGSAQGHTHPEATVDPTRELLVTHPPGVQGVRRVRVLAGRSGAAVEEVAANPRLLQTAQVGVCVFGGLKVVRPVADRGDPGVQRLQGAPKRAGVDILRRVPGRDAAKYRRVVAGTGHLRGEAADRPLPHMPVGIDQSRDHQAALSVDHFRSRFRRREVGTDLDDDAVADQHVAYR